MARVIFQPEDDILRLPRRPLMAFALLLLASAIVVLLSVTLLGGSPVGDISLSGDIAHIFSLAAASVSLILASLLILLAWHSNEPRLTLLGLSVLVLAAFVSGVGDAGAALLDEAASHHPLHLLRAAGLTVAGVLALVATFDLFTRGWWLVVIATASLVGVWVLFVGMVQIEALEHSIAAPHGPGAIAPIVLLGVAAARLFARWIKKGFGIDAWSAVLFGMVTLTGLGTLTTSSATSARFAVLGGLRLAAVIVITIAIAASLQSALMIERQRLYAAHRRLAFMALAGSSTEVAHEAKSALAAIEYAVAAIESGKEDITPGFLESAIRNEIELLRRLLTPGTPLTFEVFPLADVLASSLVVQGIAGQDIDIDMPEMLSVRADRSATVEIMQNLLENARVHAPGSPVTVSVSVQGEEAWIEVADRGPGFSDSQAAHLFKSGYSTNRSSGVGLHVVRTLAVAQGGSAWAAQRQSGGAVFGFSLRLADSDAGSEGLEHADEGVDGSHRPTGRTQEPVRSGRPDLEHLTRD